MSLKEQAGKGHLIAGAILILAALTFVLLAFFLANKYFSFAVFFFGVWGGVETGRYLEHVITKSEKSGSSKG